MFTHLTNSAKAFLFFGIAFGLTLTASLLYPLLGEMTPLIHTYTPTLSVLIMMLVVTRDGYSKTGWATLGLHRLGLRYWVLALVGPLVLMGVLYGLAWISPVGQFVLPDGFTLAPTGVQFEHRARDRICPCAGRGNRVPWVRAAAPHASWANPGTPPERPDVCALALPADALDAGLSRPRQLADCWPDTPAHADLCRRVLRLPPTEQQERLAINTGARRHQHILRVARAIHRYRITVSPGISRW